MCPEGTCWGCARCGRAYRIEVGWELYIGNKRPQNSNNWQDASLDPLRVNVRLTPWVEKTGETLLRQSWDQDHRKVMRIEASIGDEEGS